VYAGQEPRVQSTGARIVLQWRDGDRAVQTTLTAAPGRIFGRADAVTTPGNGVFVVWEESPADGSDTDVHAQHFSTDGQALWGPAGIVINNFRGHQRAPRLAPVPQGAVIVWQSDSAGAHNNNIWCQYVRHDGRAVWETPAAVCTARGQQLRPAIAADPDLGVIIAWEDYRHGNADIYAQRIDLDGAPLGPEDGAAIEDARTDQKNPRFANGPDGTLLIVWDDYRPGFAAPVQVQSDLTHLPVPEPACVLLAALFVLYLRRRR